MAKTKATKPKAVIPIDLALSEYNSLREQEKNIKARMTELAGIIKEYVTQHGTKDDKGSFYSENSNFIYGKVARNSISFDPDKAISYFKGKGFKDCIQVTESINEDNVEKRLSCGDLTVEELEDITVTKTSYSVDVKVKEQITDEVEETTVQLAASKKPKFVPRVKKGGKK